MNDAPFKVGDKVICIPGASEYKYAAGATIGCTYEVTKVTWYSNILTHGVNIINDDWNDVEYFADIFVLSQPGHKDIDFLAITRSLCGG